MWKAEKLNYTLRGREWERPVHIEIFDSTGQLLIDQDAGMRIHGGAGRSADQKSLRLYARESYGKEAFNIPSFHKNQN